MKANDNVDLKELIERLEHRQHVKKTVSTTMAVLGLVGFGVMMIPILAPYAPRQVADAPVTQPVVQHADAFSRAQLIGQAAIVYDLTTGKTLFEKNAQTQLPLASLTKLLTMYAASTALGRTSRITISDTAVAQDGDSGLSAGESFAFNDLARFALVASSNDAAEAITEAAAGVQEVSNQSLLASAASAVGLTQTYANNGTGLDVSSKISGGYGSAADVARLAGALLSVAPEVAHATIERSVSVRSTDGVLHTLPNTNQDIVHIPSPLLSKTGFTDLAGGNLVVVFDTGINHPVAVVVLGSTRDGRFSDVDQLVSLTLKHFAGL